MDIYILILINIGIIIIITLLLNTHINNNIRTNIMEETTITDSGRIIAMNGVDSKYYINFSRHYMLFNLLNIITRIFDENNIDYFISCGALLGYHRHNNSFIPWDDDIDIGVFEKDKDKITNILSLYTSLNSTYSLYKHNYDIYKFIVNNSNNDKTQIMIDLFFYKFYDNKQHYNLYTPIQQFLFPREYISNEELFPLINVNFKLYLPDGTLYNTCKVKIPNKSIDFLNRMYPGWENKKIVSKVHTTMYKWLFNK